MAQADKIPSEPSMEEILASIRRIIEESDTPKPTEATAKEGDNDDRSESGARGSHPLDEEQMLPQEEGRTVTDPVSAEPAAQPEEAASPSETDGGASAAGAGKVDENVDTGKIDESVDTGKIDEGVDIERELTSFRDELKTEETKRSPMDQLSLADIQAEVLKNTANSKPDEDKAGNKDEGRPAFTSEEFDEGQGQATAARSAEKPWPAASTEKTDEKPVTADEAGPAGASLESSDIGGMEGSRQENALARPAIISEHTGRQVSAAFEELSDAFAKSRHRSFDDIAEEMMRPMLQDWLDNNLPVLVERLVREEIDRVARGGSR